MKNWMNTARTTLGSVWTTLAAGAMITGCGARITADGVGECPSDPTMCASASAVEAEPAGENCPGGGLAIRSGRDLDQNGVLTAEETLQTAYVCNGAAGADGANGADGADGAKPEVSVTDATTEACPNGGVVVNVDGDLTTVCNGTDGLDGEDGETPELKIATAPENLCPHGGTIFSVNDVDTVVCNGAPGETGPDGRTPVVTVAPADEEQCPYGGAVVTVDGSGTNVCNGAPGERGDDGRTPVVTVSPAGPVQCTFGGAVITVDGSGTTVCNGAPGRTPSVSLTVATQAQCAEGGAILTVDGVSTLLCNGLTPRVTTSPATEAQCPAGGVVLTVDSIQDSTTVICNGEQGVDGAPGQDGANGANGHSAIVTEVVDNTATSACEGGTRTVKIGIDSGAGGGTADNNVLEAGEVLSSFVICLPVIPTSVGGSGTGPNAGEVFSMGNIKDLETLSDGSLSPTGNISVIENDYLWVVNTADSSVSKWDAQAKTEIARYKVGLKAHECLGSCCWAGGCNMPSRVVMDSNGDAYVANRGFEIQGTVTKIAADVSECVDRNGNGQVDTSSSATPLGWNDAGEHLDECILWNKPVGPPGALLRAIAIDRGDATTPNGYVWVGSYILAKVWRLDPRTGDYTATPGQAGIQLSEGFEGTYGGVVTSANVIYWTSLSGAYLAPLNATTLDVGARIDLPVRIYGATGDAQGRIWGAYLGPFAAYDPATGETTTGSVQGAVSSGITSDANGNLVQSTVREGTIQVARWPASAFTAGGTVPADQISYFDTGIPSDGNQSAVGIDRGGAVWMASYGGNSQLVRYDHATESGTQYLGPNQTYSYSDFTGSVRRAATKQGSWEGIYQIPCANAAFQNFSLYGEYPTGSTTTVSFRRAASEAGLVAAAAIPLATVPTNASPYALGTALTTAGATSGAWIKVTVVLKQGANGATPIASGFRFNWTCPAP